jgi:hypothetical protein
VPLAHQEFRQAAHTDAPDADEVVRLIHIFFDFVLIIAFLKQ